MRLQRLELSGFRAFAHKEIFDLDGDAIIVSGANGRGKTSLFDAILWCITGSVPRLGGNANLVSLYAETGDARVSLKLKPAVDGTPLTITRACDRSGDMRVRVQDGVSLDVTGSEAELEIQRRLWPSALGSSMGSEALTRAFTRTVYLEQDLIRQYLISDSDDERFAILSEIVGVGRITELQQQIAKAKRAWTQATTPVRDEAAQWTHRINEIEADLARLGDPSGSSDGADLWEDWWADARSFLESEDLAPKKLSVDAHTQIEKAILEVESRKNQFERRLARLRSTIDTLANMPVIPQGELKDMADRIPMMEKELDRANEELQNAQQRAQEHRARLVAKKEQIEELAALAQIALRHLSETCPVCTQPYDIEHTRKHLYELIEADFSTTGSEADEVAEAVENASEKVREVSLRLDRARRGRDEIERARQAREEAQQFIRTRLRELGRDFVEDDEEAILSWLNSEVVDAEAMVEMAQDLIDRGEALTLIAARIAEQDRREELENELIQAKAALAQLEKLVHQRDETGRTCEQIISALRDGEHELVRREILRFEPLLKQLYAKVDPHPTFEDVALAVTMYYGKGRLNAAVLDGHLDEPHFDPGKILSSSQLNALAVCVFLAMNYGTSNLPVDLMMLDDPIQSLDDINLLAVVDVLRRIRLRRQLIVSTHDDGYARLLQRKLRPVEDSHRTMSIEFLDWTRQGPEIACRDIPGQSTSLRVVA